MSSQTRRHGDVSGFSFEKALAELENIVTALERGEGGALPLEESIAAYERGMALSLQCERRLREARERVEKITLSGGSASAEPFDDGESSQRRP